MAISAPPALPTTLPREPLSEAVMLRICRTKFADQEPCFRTAGTYRFDSPDNSFGTCYAARDFKTCFFETIVRGGSLSVARSEYDTRSLAVLLLDAAKLHLVPVHGDGAKLLQLNLADVAGADYAYTQALSKCIHDHAQEPHGIVYRSRYDDGAFAMVLFDRASSLVRRFPGCAPVPLTNVPELANGLSRMLPLELV